MRFTLEIARVFLVILQCFIFILSYGQRPDQVLKASGTPVNPKVPIFWNRYYDSEALEFLSKKIANANPNLAKFEVIGKSYKGKNIWCLIVTDFTKGNVSEKPGIYIQGNIHGNELQGGEYSLYSAWYLTESFTDNNWIRELLREKVFYIVPTVNPDARDYFIHNPSNALQPRFTLFPFDVDNDGKFSEDGADDIDGDGQITMMRKRNPYGIWRIDSVCPQRMIKLPNDSIVLSKGKEKAKFPSIKNYDYMREGGIDNDFDGAIDEDGIVCDSITEGKRFNFNDFKADPNRGWSWGTKNNPDTLILGFSFLYQESRAIRDFFLKHPNISIAQSLHNNGGAVYRGYLKRMQARTPLRYIDNETESGYDFNLYDSLGKMANRMLPGYEYWVDTINTGGYREIDWMYAVRGAYSFIIELMPSYSLYNKSYLKREQLDNDMYAFNKEFLFNDGFVPWKEVNHPVLDKVEVGGFKKSFEDYRLTPGFLMESEAHRNMALSVQLAYATPKLEIKNISIKKINNEFEEVTVVIANTGLLPTHSTPDLKNKLRPDYILLKTNGNIISVRCIESGVSQKENPQQFNIDNILGNSEFTIQWIVKGDEKYIVTINSIKGGIVTFSTN